MPERKLRYIRATAAEHTCQDPARAAATVHWKENHDERSPTLVRFFFSWAKKTGLMLDPAGPHGLRHVP